eukprot:m.27146 g.27146  ORF g.27146 m.27146 type:complete len:205 (-) comp15693_c0_seq2:36-650(-)
MFRMLLSSRSMSLNAPPPHYQLSNNPTNSNMQLTQSNPFEEPATSTTEDALFQPREIPRDLPAYSPTSTSRRGEILTRVKKYLVNGGFDMKYDIAVYPVGLENKVDPDDFGELLEDLNIAIGKHRTRTGDILALGALTILYMPVFAYRRKKKAKRRAVSVAAVLKEFNSKHPGLRTRVDRNSGDLLFEIWPETRKSIATATELE